MSAAYQRTIDRKEALQRHVNVVELWECKLNDELAKNTAMKKFFDECEIDEAMNGRGGE